jgi:hypothetical protein
VGGCGYVLSHQALSDVTSQEPGCYGTCPVLKSLRVERRIHSDETGGKIPSIHGRRDGGRGWWDDKYGSFLSLVLFR